jgi:hypothetical protein
VTRVLFLGGLGRSGTTLVERMVGELPGVIALGEVVHLWQRGLREGDRCGCGEPFAGCEFWRQVGAAAFGGWHRVDVERIRYLRRRVERTRHIPALATGGRTALVGEYVDYYRRLYAAAAATAGAQVVVDSSKHSALAWCLSRCQLDLRVVHVVRDPRAVAYSWTKRRLRPESSAGAEMTRYSPARSALLWNAHNAALGLLGRCGTPVARVRYEEFLAQPRQRLREIARVAGLEVSDPDLEFLDRDTVRLRVGHSVAGNPMRFTTGTVPLRRDEAWRRALPPRQRGLVGTLCAPWLAGYGYPIRSARQLRSTR